MYEAIFKFLNILCEDEFTDYKSIVASNRLNPFSVAYAFSVLRENRCIEVVYDGTDPFCRLTGYGVKVKKKANKFDYNSVFDKEFKE